MQVTQQFNSGDRTGRMNNLIAASREVVFTSRQVQVDSANTNPNFAPLAQLYVDQAREGAQLVSTEYQRLLRLSLSESPDIARSAINESQDRCVLPWVQMQPSKLVNLDVGYIVDGESNVAVSSGNPGLYDFDKQAKNFDEQTMLLYGNRTLTLPAPDNDLSFRISALPAPVVGTTSPARLIAGEDFAKMIPLVANGMPTAGACEYMPCASQVKLSAELKSSLGWANQSVSVNARAVANGGCSLPTVVVEIPK